MDAAADLHWIPLGAGGHSVRFNGMVYEALAAAWQRRIRCDLYHAALTARLDGDPYAVELAPAGRDPAAHGVVAAGPVGAAWAGRLRLFRYEVRCWRGGEIPDLAYAVGEPRRLTEDPDEVRRLLDRLASVPRLTWGRDELATGEMWNSNSVVAWLIVTSGLPAEGLAPPPGGRAPGWRAGLVAAQRGRQSGMLASRSTRRAPEPSARITHTSNRSGRGQRV